MIARSEMRRRAVRKALRTASREAAALALLLAEGLDDLHRAQQSRRRSSPDRRSGPGCCARCCGRAGRARRSARTIGGMPISSQIGELGREGEQIDDAADAEHDVAQRDRDGRADHHLDHRRVGGDARGDLGRPVLLEEARLEAQQIVVHGDADVGDHLLAEHRDEIEAEGGRHREHGDHQEQIVELLRDVAAAGDEALVDDPAEAVGDGERRPRREQQGDAGAERSCPCSGARSARSISRLPIFPLGTSARICRAMALRLAARRGRGSMAAVLETGRDRQLAVG